MPIYADVCENEFAIDRHVGGRKRKVATEKKNKEKTGPNNITCPNNKHQLVTGCIRNRDKQVGFPPAIAMRAKKVFNLGKDFPSEDAIPVDLDPTTNHQISDSIFSKLIEKIGNQMERLEKTMI